MRLPRTFGARVHARRCYGNSRIYFNNSTGIQSGYGLVSARVTWSSPDEKWAVAAYGTNLGDEVYYEGKLALVPNLGREQGNVGAPRQWGISLRRNF